jgi:peptidyl-tRNA hydrolase, PTH2 family
MGPKGDNDDPLSEVDGKNPDGTAKIKDEVLKGAFPIKDVKLVMVVREDLKMTKGKIGAQCGHATLAAFEQTTAYAKKSDYWAKVLKNWNWEGQKKVCLKVVTEQEL